MTAGAIILWILAAIFVGVGVAGLVFPVLPGPLMILIGLVLAAWAEGFVHVGPVVITLLAVLAVTAIVVDYLAGAIGAQRFGASRRAMIGAAVGTLAGLLFGLPGVIIGPFAGAVAGELSLRKNLRAAGVSGFGALLGMVVGAVAKVAVGFLMIGTFLMARFL